MQTNDKDLEDISAQDCAEQANEHFLLPRFRRELGSHVSRENFKQSMIIDHDGPLSVCYGALEYINPYAKVVLIGLTPGEQQAQRANEAVAEHLANGQTELEALKAAKVFASFSGPMRPNLIALLDEIGLARRLGVDSTQEFFGTDNNLCHFTSALRFPVFVNNRNYSGSPSILGQPLLKRMVDVYLGPELSRFEEGTWYVPLGKEASVALKYLSGKGVIPESHVLDGLPHPSGANAERIAYFLGKKSKASLSSKTNAEALDAAKRRLILKVEGGRAMGVKQVQSIRTNTPEGAPEAPNSDCRGSNRASASGSTMPGELEARISDLAKRKGFSVLHRSARSHEIEVKFDLHGREETLYINRKSYWRKDLLKVTLRPKFSESITGHVVSAQCASRLLNKGGQLESYSSNFKAFGNKRLAKGDKNEHFGHAWTVPIDHELSSLKTFFEKVSAGN